MLFVPSETPHFVDNLISPSSGAEHGVGSGLTLAVSANFLDPTNFDCAVGALARIAITDNGAANLVKLLTAHNFDQTIDSELEVGVGVPWDTFKRKGFL
jgi:hypothetical protein